MLTFRRAAVPFARFATQGLARILMFHRFGPPGTLNPRRFGADLLDRQLNHLRRHYRVVRLQDFAANLHAGRRFAPGTVALTVDDGYADFGEHAYPVFQRHGLPVTLYVVSDFAAGKIWLWFDLLRHMLNCALHGQYTGTVLGDPLRLSLNDCGSREAAWWALAGRVVNLTPDGRRCFLEEMQRVLGVALPTGPTREYAPMTWAQLRELDPAIVEIGAHTRTHAILSRCGAEALHQELVVSKEVIERELGRSIVSFCYPNGQPGDVNDAAVAAVREAGYESAVMACGTFVRRGADRFLLSRMGSPTDWEAFIAESSGLSHVWKRLRSAGASDL